MRQQDLSGRTIDEQEEDIETCLKYRERKASLKIIYPGTKGFNITISAADSERLNDIDTDKKRREYVIKKMRLRPKANLAVNEEGKALQHDLNTFLKILWPTGTEHMSPETYEALMKERYPQEVEEQQQLPSKKTKELQDVAKSLHKKTKKEKLIAELQNKFGTENVKVEHEVTKEEQEELGA